MMLVLRKKCFVKTLGIFHNFVQLAGWRTVELPLHLELPHTVRRMNKLFSPNTWMRVFLSLSLLGTLAACPLLNKGGADQGTAPSGTARGPEANVEGYGGRVVRRYYWRDPEYTCNGGASYRGILEETEDGLYYSLGDSCTSNRTLVNRTEIDFSIREGLAGHGPGIYQSFELPPEPDDNTVTYVSAWCSNTQRNTDFYIEGIGPLEARAYQLEIVEATNSGPRTVDEMPITINRVSHLVYARSQELAPPHLFDAVIDLRNVFQNYFRGGAIYRPETGGPLAWNLFCRMLVPQER